MLKDLPLGGLLENLFDTFSQLVVVDFLLLVNGLFDEEDHLLDQVACEQCGALDYVLHGAVLDSH